MTKKDIKLIFSIIIFLLLFEVVAFAQQSELPDPGLTPDSPFYFFDTLAEKIEIFFSFSPEKKAEKAIYYADEKLAEIEKMAEENEVEPMEKANQNYQKYLELANQKVKEAKEKGKDIEELATLISEKTLKHQKILLEIYGKALDEAKTGIEKAMESSKRGFEEAVKNVSKGKREELQRKENKIGKEMKCKKIQDLGKQNRCWIDLAKETKNENYCRNIKTFKSRADCYTALAILKNDSSICEKIEKGLIYESCKEYFEIKKQTKIKKQTVDWKTYKNEEYGYEFKYPQEYFLKEVLGIEGTPTGTLLLRKTEAKETEWLIEVFVEGDIIDPLYDTSKMSFIEFAVDRIRAYCAADGPMGSIYCTDVISQEKIINDQGIEGYKIYITEVDERYQKGKTVTSKRTKGPIFAFDISKQTGARGIFFQLTGLGEKNLEKESQILEKIVSTFKFIQKKSADWRTYRNEKYGYEIKYPGEWEYREEIPQPQYFGLMTYFSDAEGKHVLTIENPIPEIGYEPWVIKKTEQIKIQNSKKYLTKMILEPNPEIHEEFNNLIVVIWNKEDWEHSGQITLSYKDEKDPNIKILNQMLSTFRFLE